MGFHIFHPMRTPFAEAEPCRRVPDGNSACRPRGGDRERRCARGFHTTVSPFFCFCGCLFTSVLFSNFLTRLSLCLKFCTEILLFFLVQISPCLSVFLRMSVCLPRKPPALFNFIYFHAKCWFTFSPRNRVYDRISEFQCHTPDEFISCFFSPV